MYKGVLMDTKYLSPYIRVAMDSIIHPPWSLPERVIFDYELLYVMEGNIHVTVEDNSYNGKAGDVFLFKPKQRHSISVIGENCFRQPHIHFDLFYTSDSPEVKVSFKALEEMSDLDMKKFRRDITNCSSMQLPNRIHIQNIKLFEEMLFDIIKEYEMKLPFYETNLQGLFIRLWTYLNRENFWHTNPVVLNKIPELMKVREYLNCNSNKEVSMKELAEVFNISKYYLIRLFKKSFGISPIHYHQLLRIERAKKMIQFTELSFTEISDTLGFSCIHAFSRAFKKTEGVAPSFYRGR